MKITVGGRYRHKRHKRIAYVKRRWTWGSGHDTVVYRYATPLPSRSNRRIMMDHCKEMQVSAAWFAAHFEEAP